MKLTMKNEFLHTNNISVVHNMKLAMKTSSDTNASVVPSQSTVVLCM